MDWWLIITASEGFVNIFSIWQSLTYAQRAQLCSHPVSKKLFTIMEEKKTNLAFSVDVTKTDQILKVNSDMFHHESLVLHL